MAVYNKIGVGAKILSAILIVIGLMLVNGVNSIGGGRQMSSTVKGLVNDLATERQIAADIVEQVTLVRFHANEYIATQDQVNLNAYKNAVTQLSEFLSTAKPQVTQPDRAKLLSVVTSRQVDYQYTFNLIDQLIDQRQTIVTTNLDIYGPKA